jgi:hypothetical protein
MPRMKWSELKANLPPEVQERVRKKTEALLAEMEKASGPVPEWDESLNGCGNGESEEVE